MCVQYNHVYSIVHTFVKYSHVYNKIMYFVQNTHAYGTFVCKKQTRVWKIKTQKIEFLKYLNRLTYQV